MSLYSQNITVQGSVKDTHGELLIGVTVQVTNTSIGTVTDMDGRFTLQNVPSAGTLEVSYVGMKTQLIPIEGKRQFEITLEEDAEILDEVVVVGYGTQTRREITGSIANVSEEDFNKGITRDASDLLQGKVAGLIITSGSGDVTRGSQIRLRGTSTLQNDQGPMIVIDGIPGGDMSTVSPSDIESISVLKDASSAAIYGSRAAGGVILITTKRGSGAQSRIQYDGYVSVDQVANKPDMMNAQQWRDTNAKLGNDISTFSQYTADTDWFGEMLRTGVSNNHSLSLSGGGSRHNYRASYTYLDRIGIARDNEMTRHSFRLQFQQRAINDRLRVGITTSGTITDMQFPFIDDYILAYNMPPVYPVFNADGSYFTAANNNYDQGNPVQNQDQNYRKSSNNYFYGSGDVQFDITKDLNIKATLYKSRFSNEYSEWRDPRNSRGYGSNGLAAKRANRWDRELMEWTGNYEVRLGADEDHKIDAIAGYSWELNESSNQSAQATDFIVSSMGADNIQAGNLLKIGEVTSGRNAYKLISFFGRAHYSYQERYMVTATVRRDGSSKFGANHKWGTFPSASAAWGISQESFMKDVKWVNDLKLRAGYGVTGNQDGLRPYRSLELYSAAGTYYSDGSQLTAFRISQNANPDLKWESTAMLNIGLDFALFNNRLSGTIELYDKRTSDMLYTYNVPTPTYVYDRIQANVGDMSNKGVELMLNIDVVKNKNFTYNTSINLAHNKNEVTKLSNELYQTGRIYAGDPWIRGASGVTSHVVEVGYPVGQFYMLKCTGLTEDGKFIIEDINDDGQITDDDRTYVGSSQPDLTFGWNNSFNYKRWDASIFFRGTVGNKVLNNPRAAYGNNTYISGANALNDELVQKLSENSRVSSFYLEDASHIRLDNLALGYTFNTSHINWLDRARIYVAGQNLFVITGYKGLDPEVEIFRGAPGDSGAGLSPGIEPRNYMPKARSFTFGVNITF